MVQKQVINTVKDVKRSNDLFQAQSVGESVGDFVSYVIDKHEAGFSLEEMTCKYVGGVLVNQEVPHTLCADGTYFKAIADRQWAKGNNMAIQVSVKGKPSAKANEKYGKCVGNLSTCYGIPAPATGDAGNSTLCQEYKETIALENSALKKTTGQTMDDIDNPCNWNKLTFGSSATDRVAIPLYYDNSIFKTLKLEDLKDAKTDPSDMKYPFQDGNKNFILRVRTPCLPCVDKDLKTGQEPSTLPAGTRHCEAFGGKTYSPYYCADSERYILDNTEKDGTPDDMVISWQITGKCGNDECGMIYLKGEDKTDITLTAIFESFINGNKNHDKNRIIDTTIKNTDDKPLAKDTSNYKETPKIIDKLKTMTKPVFSMFLSGKLLTADKTQFVPNLEYQFLTDTPIGQAEIESEIQVIINNTVYTKKLEKAEKRPLIDFAIQN